MKKIDMENWNRKELFAYYHKLSDPRYSLTFEVDVTEAYNYSKRENLSFYYTMIYLVTKAMNSIENFRYVIKGDHVYVLDALIPSFTDIRKGSDTFHIAALPAGDSLIDFNRSAREVSCNQKSFFDFPVSPLEMIHISSVPWLFMTGLVREKNMNAEKGSDDTAPHVVWGRYKEIGGRKILNMNVEVNHQTVDGYHIGKFYEKLVELMTGL